MESPSFGIEETQRSGFGSGAVAAVVVSEVGFLRYPMYLPGQPLRDSLWSHRVVVGVRPAVGSGSWRILTGNKQPLTGHQPDSLAPWRKKTRRAAG